MHDTVKHMLQNFKYLIEKYGYIPNGGRTYMLQRTQPPFFIPMVYEYHTVTADDEFLLSIMGSMEAVAFLTSIKIFDYHFKDSNKINFTAKIISI